MICGALDYGQSESSYVQNMSEYFNQGLNSMLASDSMPAALVGPHYIQPKEKDLVL